MSRRQDPLESLLGPLEQDVMDVVWQIGEATVRDVHEELVKGRKIAYTTVMTTMARLATKGLLRRDTSGLAHRYHPAVSQDAYLRSALGRVLTWALERYPEPAASYLTEVADSMEGNDLDELRAAVERRRSKED